MHSKRARLVAFDPSGELGRGESHALLCKNPPERRPGRGKPGFHIQPQRITSRSLAIVAALLVPQSARASLFSGDTLDAVANGIAWVVLVIAPIIGITVFWLVHILPEKIAHKKKHPQTRAIQCLCLLSLFFGGLLWPIAWLWAYSKPVLHRAAYGTDVDESLAHPEDGTHATTEEPSKKSH